MTLTDQMAAYFRAHPHRWIHWDRLIAIGGRGGWRTRVSECRAELGMAIEKPRVRERRSPSGKKYRVVFYRYAPPRTLLEIAERSEEMTT